MASLPFGPAAMEWQKTTRSPAWAPSGTRTIMEGGVTSKTSPACRCGGTATATSTPSDRSKRMFDPGPQSEGTWMRNSGAGASRKRTREPGSSSSGGTTCTGPCGPCMTMGVPGLWPAGKSATSSTGSVASAWNSPLPPRLGGAQRSASGASHRSSWTWLLWLSNGSSISRSVSDDGIAAWCDCTEMLHCFAMTTLHEPSMASSMPAGRAARAPAGTGGGRGPGGGERRQRSAGCLPPRP
mmetsp:Transcript_76836/g.225544  ORF Transcript_76836/g.225544 Transcript_76836/m.225544 type:complete len:240 (-) Transcript_76836:15-734(-)